MAWRRGKHSRGPEVPTPDTLSGSVKGSGAATAHLGGVAVSGIQIGDNYTAALPMARSAYVQQVRRIAPAELVGRQEELAELEAFCTADGGRRWVWWQAPAWAGKSALMAWFVLHHPPERIRVVSFFITARWAGNSDRAAFVDVMLEQLAEVAGQPMPAFLTDANREAHLLGLLEKAAQACRNESRRLVLVVDGLDEDRGVTVGPGMVRAPGAPYSLREQGSTNGGSGAGVALVDPLVLPVGFLGRSGAVIGPGSG